MGNNLSSEVITIRLYLSDRGYVHQGPRRHPQGSRAQARPQEEGPEEEMERQEAHSRGIQGQGLQAKGGVHGPNRSSKRLRWATGFAEEGNVIAFLHWKLRVVFSQAYEICINLSIRF